MMTVVDSKRSPSCYSQLWLFGFWGCALCQQATLPYRYNLKNTQTLITFIVDVKQMRVQFVGKIYNTSKSMSPQFDSL